LSTRRTWLAILTFQAMQANSSVYADIGSFIRSPRRRAQTAMERALHEEQVAPSVASQSFVTSQQLPAGIAEIPIIATGSTGAIGGRPHPCSQN
jgi:hypothetical protein